MRKKEDRGCDVSGRHREWRVIVQTKKGEKHKLERDQRGRNQSRYKESDLRSEGVKREKKKDEAREREETATNKLPNPSASPDGLRPLPLSLHVHTQTPHFASVLSVEEGVT